MAPPDPPVQAPRLQLLGTPCVLHGGRRWPLERKDAALLALLAERGSLRRDDAAALLWPDATPALARSSLRQRLYRLRRNLACDIAQGTVVLALAPGVGHDLDDPAALLRTDPDALAGELLAGCAYVDAEALGDWLAGARGRWAARRAEALAALAEEHELAGALATALRYALRLVQHDPLAEHAHRRVMRLHYRRGDGAAARAAFEHCRAVLARELGAAPDDETAALARLAQPERLAVAVAAPPVATLRPPRLVGRAAELDRAHAALAAGQILVVEGEAGIGKTRLLEELAAAQPGALLTGARAGDARLPLALLARLVRAGQARFAPGGTGWPPWVRDALAGLLPELGPPPARSDALRLHQAVSHALAAWCAQGLEAVFVDDLHHADAASLAALLALFAARPGGAPRWAVGVRAAESPAEFEAWRTAAEPGTAAAVALAPLDLAAVRALLDTLDLPGLDASTWAPALLAHTGGNPLFILETLRSALAAPGGRPAAPATAAAPRLLPMPQAIGTLIETRLARLSPAALRLARTAALAGDSFDGMLANDVLGCHPADIVEPWAELERAQVLRDSAFAHDLIADGVLRGIPQPVAQLLHARLADALEARPGSAAAVAHHRAGAEQWDRAGAAYVAAADAAQRASHHADEMVLRERAGAAFDQAGRPDLAFDARCAGVEAVLLVRGAEAAGALAQSLLEAAATPRDRSRALAAQAHARLMAADPQRGVEAARAALVPAQALGDPALVFEASRLLAIGLAQVDRSDEALATLQPLHDTVHAQSTTAQRQRYWSDIAYVLNTAGRLRDTVDALERALAIARQQGDHAEMAVLTANLATAEGNFGRPARALQHAQAARALADPLGPTAGTAAGMIEMTVAQYGVRLGRYAEGIEGLESAARHFAADGQLSWVAVTHHHLARAFVDLGQPARALQLLATPPAAELKLPQVRARRLALLARCRRALGRADPRALAEAIEVLGPAGHPYVLMLTRLERAWSQPAGAAADCAAVAAWAARQEYLGIETQARLLGAHCHLAAGETAAALALVADAPDRIAHWAPVDMNPAEAWWTVWRVQHTAGASAAARAALLAGRRWLEATLLQVPAPFRESFLQRNETHRALLAAAAVLDRGD